MKLSISNIAWSSKPLETYLHKIRELGCQGIELAPSLIWNEPIDANASQIKKIKKIIEDADLEIVGLHALLFSRPDLQLFSSRESNKRTLEYLSRLLTLCSDLGGNQIVFGSPSNRKLHNRNYDNCYNQSIRDFNYLGEQAAKNNIFFCIEPLSSRETEFIQSVKEGGELVKKVNHSNFKLHIDTKSIFNSKESIRELTSKYSNLIQHVHVGDIDLKEPGSINTGHLEIGQALREISYNKYVSIEMRENKKHTFTPIKRSINFLKKTYKHDSD